MITISDVRRAFGRREFAARDLAEVQEVPVDSARAAIQRMVRAGQLARTDNVLQYVDDAGRPTRGRPQHLYRLV